MSVLNFVIVTVILPPRELAANARAAVGKAGGEGKKRFGVE